MQDYLTLPLLPKDLVEIYSNNNKIIKVNLQKSIDNIPLNQLLVYIANTKFEVEFNDVTDDLLVKYMETDFNVKSKQLDLIIMDAIREFTKVPAISQHIVDFHKLLKCIPNYVLMNIEKYSEGSIKGEEVVFKMVPEKLSIGFNAIKLFKECQLLMFEMIQKDGVEEEIYTYYMNNNPKFSGNDLYYYLYSINYMPTVLSILGNLISKEENN